MSARLHTVVPGRACIFEYLMLARLHTAVPGRVCVF
jgi:hypothetical protein